MRCILVVAIVMWERREPWERIWVVLCRYIYLTLQGRWETWAPPSIERSSRAWGAVGRGVSPRPRNCVSAVTRYCCRHGSGIMDAF